MKITIDKNYTAVNQVKPTQQMCKEFKNYFTDNDLLRMFNEETNNDIIGKIIKCEVSAMPLYFSGTYSFNVDMIVYDLANFYEISYFMHYEDNAYSINKDPMLLTCKKYGLICIQ